MFWAESSLSLKRLLSQDVERAQWSKCAGVACQPAWLPRDAVPCQDLLVPPSRHQHPQPPPKNLQDHQTGIMLISVYDHLLLSIYSNSNFNFPTRFSPRYICRWIVCFFSKSNKLTLHAPNSWSFPRFSSITVIIISWASVTFSSMGPAHWALQPLSTLAGMEWLLFPSWNTMKGSSLSKNVPPSTMFKNISVTRNCPLFPLFLMPSIFWYKISFLS